MMNYSENTSPIINGLNFPLRREEEYGAKKSHQNIQKMNGSSYLFGTGGKTLKNSEDPDIKLNYEISDLLFKALIEESVMEEELERTMSSK